MLFFKKVINIMLKTIMIIFYILFLTQYALGQSKTIMQDGKWLSNVSVFIVNAEISNKIESVCLPRIEFIDDVREEEVNLKLKEGIKSQGAVFHLFHDGTGKPIRVNNMLFSQDVFLKDLKQTYTSFLRSLGYKFRVNKKPAFEDNDYLSKIQNDVMLRLVYGAKSKAKSTEDKGEEHKIQMQSDVSINTASNFEVKTIWDSMPAGVIHPSLRKTKEELESKLREIKNRPFERERIIVDPLRWASGRMGNLLENGTIEKAYLEGQYCNLKLLLSKNIDKNWYEKYKALNLENVNCEFILFRNKLGSDLYKDNSYFLADIYFVDLGSTFSELFSNDINSITTNSEIIRNLEIATTSMELQIKVEHGKWKALKALGLAEVNLGSKSEIIRVAPPQSARKVKNVKMIIDELNKIVKDQEIRISFIMCPDGSYYKELDQKRARRIFFPQLNKTLLVLLDEIAEKFNMAQ